MLSYKRIILILFLIIVFISIYRSHSFFNFSLENTNEVKNLIINEIPALKNRKNLSDFETANMLREWAFKHILKASDNSLLIINVMGVSDASNIPLDQRLKLYREGAAGSFCGASAYTLLEIYNLFGFQTYIVDFGNSPKATHMVTLIKIINQGKEILSIQDSYLNYTFLDEQDKPLDYFQFLKFLKAGDFRKIKILSGDDKYKNVLISKNSISQYSPEKVFPNGNILIQERIPDLDFNKITDFGEDMKIFLQQYRYPNNILYLYLFPFYITGDDNSQKLLDHAQQTTGYSCYPSKGCNDVLN